MNPLLSALVAAGIISPDDAERINRQLDPEAARAWAEQQLAVAMQAGLSDQQARLIEAVRRNGGTLSPAQLDAFWAAEDDRLWEVLRPTWEQVAAEHAIGAAITMGAGDAMWGTINEQVVDWANTYYTAADPAFVGSVPNLVQTSREQVAAAFTRWNRGGLNDGRQGGLPALVAELARVETFGPGRAEIVASTEVTRIFSEAESVAAASIDELAVKRWDTAYDDVVCSLCAPLNGRIVDKDAEFEPGVMLPPRHPRCRCGVTFLSRNRGDNANRIVS
jgi:SPP1 gp7 family putative phage head morphogenesis protein